MDKGVLWLRNAFQNAFKPENLVGNLVFTLVWLIGNAFLQAIPSLPVWSRLLLAAAALVFLITVILWWRNRPSPSEDEPIEFPQGSTGVDWEGGEGDLIANNEM